MKKYVLLFLFTLIFPLCARAQTYTISVFGDSLTAGYDVEKTDSFPAQLVEFLYEDGYKTRVSNNSVTGDTTQKGLQRISDVAAQMPDVIIIEFGMNDVIQGVPIETTEKNLARMISLAQKNDIAVLLAGVSVPPIRKDVLPEDYADMYAALAEKYDVPLYKNILEGVADYARNLYDPKLLGKDQMHPNEEGISVMVEGILPQVKQILNALDVKYAR